MTHQIARCAAAVVLVFGLGAGAAFGPERGARGAEP